MEYDSIVTVTSIIIITTLFASFIKNGTKVRNELIPCFAGLIGGILGLLGMILIPEFPADNWLDALATGISSGFAATGVHQITKIKLKEDKK